MKRWKLAIQGFDFKVEHIRGVDNIEADAFSRLVPFPEEMKNRLNSMRQFKHNETLDDPQPLPKHIYSQIEAVHGGKLGHGGVQRTLNLLEKQNKSWKGMRKNVTSFIKRCPCCQKMSQIKPLIHTKPFVLAAYEPMERICIDTIGPIHEENQDELFNYILVIIDAFSRFVRLYPVKDTTAQSALTALTDWICTFGCPSAIVSDNGTQFVNNLITAFLGTSRIQHALIHAYSSEENGIVERCNKEVNRHIRSMAYDDLLKAFWVQNCPYVQRILNTQIHSSIGVSPSQLIFGDAINHDAHFLMEPKRDDVEHTYHDSIAQLYANQERLLQVARQTQSELDNFHLAQREKGEITSFPINSYVLAEYETSRPSKFTTNLHGPYRVVNVTGSVYTLQNLVTNKCVDFHVKLLREFHYDSEHNDPAEVAKHDLDYDNIQQILGHRFTDDRKRKSDLAFHIMWARNHAPEWEQWNSTLAANETIHNYLRENRLARFIPPIYTWPKDHPDYIPPNNRRKANKLNSKPKPLPQRKSVRLHK